jgi:hypothetical protein
LLAKKPIPERYIPPPPQPSAPPPPKPRDADEEQDSSRLVFPERKAEMDAWRPLVGGTLGAVVGGALSAAVGGYIPLWAVIGAVIGIFAFILTSEEKKLVGRWTIWDLFRF